jgi:hypothetical protein
MGRSDLNITEAGSGIVQQDKDLIRLSLPAASHQTYSNAQITSYRNRYDFSYSPPVRLEVNAWAEGSLHGTAGFGFWNHPFAPGERSFALPKAIWFFHGSPPNNMALAKGVPGYGWKTATFDAARWQFFTLLPTAPIGFLLMRSRPLYNLLWGIGQSAIGVSERLLDSSLLSEKHSYAIDWLPDEILFSVDEQVIHRAAVRIRGRLGFVAWVDNQYAVVTPQGNFGWGLVDVPESQTLYLDHLNIITQ